jgi:hypothetical protein
MKNANTPRRTYRLPTVFAYAAEAHIDGEKLGRLIAAEEHRQSRDAAIAYAGALAKMAGALPVIEENGILRHGDKVIGAYALWEDINDAIRPILMRFGFALSFRVSQEGPDVNVTAVLMHKRGHVETATLRLPPDPSGDKNSVQAVGSAVSYGKRYAASALLNLTSRGEDDDGRRAGGCITQEQVAFISTQLLACGADRTRFLRYLQVEEINLIPAARFDEALAALAAKPLKPRGSRS